MLHSINEINKENIISESLQQYLSIKEENFDSIILFQVGKFYLALFEDAKILSEISGLTLGTRTFKGIGEVIQCGFNIGSNANVFIKQLLDNGYKVCLCGEFIDEDNNFNRQVIRKYTKGTILESELLDIAENNYILMLFKNKKTYEISYADVSTGQFYKTSGDYNEIKIEIEKIEPCEVLILKKQEKYFEDILSKYNITYLDSEYESQNIQTCIEKYCIETQKEFCAKLDKLITYEINNYLAMDEITRQNLELTRTRRFMKKKGSLLWFLNYTKTPMGTRLLKKYLSEPLLNLEKIKKRQEAVSELFENKEILTSFEKVMRDFCDLSRGCTKISNKTVLPKDLYSIAQNSTPLEDLYDLCAKTKSKLLKLDNKKIEKTLEFANEIKTAIKKDASNELKSGGIIKEGYSATLDYLWDKFNNCEDRMNDYQEKEKKRFNINDLKVLKSPVLGFYIETKLSNAHKFPSEYKKIQATRSYARFTSSKLQELEKEYSSLKSKINDLEYELYSNIRSNAVQFVDVIRLLAQEIAQIDVFVSWARCALENNLIKPTFNSMGIYIKDGFHPSLIKLNNQIVKNDTSINNGEMFIITGANMSGKSTYLKYNAIIALLAQIGSFVPAKVADMTIIDKIFIRQGATDDIVNNNSSFMVEMNDLKFILDNVTDSSFILLDEPAKSTNAKEGGAIARAFCEYLLKYHKAKVMVATHNFELTKMEATYPRVQNYVIGNEDISEATVNDRKIKRGIINSSLAINTAILAKIPNEIINSAKNYALT